ncbi:MAG: hypothetical protein IE927_01860, partial [Rhodobacterales bacterium]|nr:hypothetical protein [Rhodobacterales bacterium]
MIAPRIGPGQEQFDRTLGLGQTRHGRGARGIDGKDQHPVGTFLDPPQPQIGRLQIQRAVGSPRGQPAAIALPGGRHPQRGDQVQRRGAARPPRPCRQRAAAAIARAHGPAARAGLGGPRRTPARQLGQQIARQGRAGRGHQQLQIAFALIRVVGRGVGAVGGIG